MSDIFLPIPAEQEKMLKTPSCNFSLYSPRMVKWKTNGKELEPDTEIIGSLKDTFNTKRLSQELRKKQDLQAFYVKVQQDSGVQFFSFNAKTTSPFITGLGSGHPTETGMILDRNLGVPYIPASSIKGVLRLAHAINIANGRTEVPDIELERYFGTTDQKQEKQYRGQLVFLDAYPVRDVKLKVDIMNPHYTKYYSGVNPQPVETESPIPIKFLAVEEGAEFCFRVAFVPLNLEDTCDEKEIRAMFKTAFETVGFGGKTAIGYGRFKECGQEESSKSTAGGNSQTLKKETVAIEPGMYEAVVADFTKSGKTITGIEFIVKTENGTVKAVKNKGCKSDDNKRYQKGKQVIVTITGEIFKEMYVVTELKLKN